MKNIITPTQRSSGYRLDTPHKTQVALGLGLVSALTLASCLPGDQPLSGSIAPEISSSSADTITVDSTAPLAGEPIVIDTTTPSSSSSEATSGSSSESPVPDTSVTVIIDTNQTIAGGVWVPIVEEDTVTLIVPDTTQPQ